MTSAADVSYVSVGPNGGLKRMSDSMAQSSAGGGPSGGEYLESSDAKKAKPNEQPSSVLHIRNIPEDTTEVEIVMLGMPFGTPVNVMVMRGAKKHQAFLEMADEMQATRLVNHYASSPATVRGRSAYIQFSNHKKLTMDDHQSSKAISLAQAMIGAAGTSQAAATPPMQPAVATMGNFPLGMSVFGAPYVNPIQQAAAASTGAPPSVMGAIPGVGLLQNIMAGAQEAVPSVDVTNDDGVMNSVLRVIVENMLYPITIDVLYLIFSKFGRVMKIVTFYKNGQFHALIQYPDADTASAALVALNGQNVWNGCCMLKIDYSNLTKLEVRQDSDRARDFTKETPENYLSHDPVAAATLQLSKSKEMKERAASVYQQQQQLQQPGAIPALMNNMSTLPGSAVMPQYSTALLNAGTNTNPFVMSGINPLGMSAVNPLGVAGISPLVLPGVNPLALPGVNPLGLGMHGVGPMGMPGVNSLGMTAVGGFGMTQAGCVIIVSNLEERRVTPDSLFTLFGVYGDVLRVKIMYNKRDTALVQFTEAAQAHLAIQYLNGKVLYDKPMRINLSKHAFVQLPRDVSEEESHLTQDYTESKLHRYNHPSSHNARNVFPPSPTLHLSNICVGVTEAQVRGVFTDAGFTVINFQWFRMRDDTTKRDQRQMALIELVSLEQAMEAVIALHNFEMNDGNHLRVTFAKNPTITPKV
ncbi:polypyrimidine tract-binding protein 1-like isoform X2 [Corticium candelabrum]|uniref:polypyrimidine tract-binding protein 1-like isoform X2 n=1 Tax=Corticium candelabrum TaxID=121492 RepID=UPI002E253565|nr:polypyrimidine tract-binding protein 1-like isoform X2 [Corticium candelabrum]